MNVGQLVALPLWLILLIVVVTVLWFIFQRQYEHTLTRRRAMEATLAEKRQKLYEEFVEDFWSPITTGKMDEEKAVAFLRKWSRSSWLVSSDEVIRAMIRVIAGSGSDAETSVVGGRLFVALRKDMGNPTSLTVRDWMRLTIKRDEWGLIEKTLRVPIPDRTRLKAE
ncbi:MAG: hypothetical protein ABI401_03605 [Candidatus Dormibacter sp.]